MPIQSTTALRKISAMRKPIRVVRGGQGSAKTISILILLINHAASVPDREILIISAELTKMRLTVIKDFIKVMKAAGIYSEARFLAETLYKFPNGSFIKFIGLDKEDVGKGLRSHVAYFNEVNKCNRESYVQVASRTEIVYADYNPDAEFFIDTDVIPGKDCSFVQLTFNDNELLPEREKENILNYYTQGYNEDGTVKNSYWANKWQVYGLGNIGSLEGVIFNNWDIVDSIPLGPEFLGIGMDFGFNDPTCAGKIFKNRKELWIKQLIYEPGLWNRDIIERFNKLGVDYSMKIVADNEDPKAISEIAAAGFNIERSEKGPDSVIAGIDMLQGFKIHFTSDSPNMINDFRNYIWKQDKNGKSLNEPVNRNKHTADSIIYLVRNKLSSSGMFEVW